jgi:hypothetical protein
MGYIITFILGIIVGTVGITGVTHLADRGVNQIQNTARDMAR